jgi:histidinol dehydrogenase
MEIIESSDTKRLERLFRQQAFADPAVERRAKAIVAAVRRDGDRALLSFARRLDRLERPLEVSRDEIEAGWRDTPRAIRDALGLAAAHIRRVAARQVPRPWTMAVAPGVVVEQRVTALARVGCYVPGGRYPLPSSLLMTAIPAAVAGVEDVVVVCPRPERVVLAAAREAGVTKLFRVGGAHAIGALAYGTESIPRVDKIVGPGNAFVAAAKNFVARDCPIDFQAGPTEIVVLARNGRPDWIAADLLAQAEHDPDARALLVTPSRTLAKGVTRAVAAQLEFHEAARPAMTRHGAVIVTRGLDEAVSLVNRLAAEHVVCDTDRIARQIRHAGTIFVGPFTAQAAGDYATGSNHVLPTAGAARFRGGLSAADFVRVTSVQRLTRRGLTAIAPAVVALASAEGLRAHAASIEIRMARSRERAKKSMKPWGKASAR